MKEKLKKLADRFVYGPEDYTPSTSSSTIKILAGGYLVYLVYKMYKDIEGGITPLFVIASVLFTIIGFGLVIHGFLMYKRAMIGDSQNDTGTTEEGNLDEVSEEENEDVNI